MSTYTVGLIADTHGLLRPQALERLRGSDYIVHAGDIGGPAILETLASLAPLIAVRGNNDRGAWAEQLPLSAVLRVGEVAIYTLHDLGELAIDPAAAGFQVVVCGHSHQPATRLRAGVLFVNPGSAGPRRFRLPVSLACLRVTGNSVRAQLIPIA